MPANHNYPTVLNARDRESILEKIEKRVYTSHINVAGVDYGEWTRELERQKPFLLSADTEGFENGVRNILKGLKSSHTGFFHGVHNRFLPQHSINATFKAVANNGSERWMFLDVFPDGPAEKAQIRPGDFLVSVDGAPSAPPSFPPFTTGESHELVVTDIDGRKSRTARVSVPIRKGTKQRPPIVEPKAVTSQVLPGRVGLLRVPYFSGAVGIRFGKELGPAVSVLTAQGCDRLIIDLRGNIGGSLGFAILASYLCPEQRPIGYSVTPKSLRRGYDRAKLPQVPMPGSKASLIFKLASFAVRDKSVVLLTQGLGPQPFHGRVVVLVNEWSNSASEMLAGFAAENSLATVVGTKTPGNVLGAQNFPVGNNYSVRLPVFGWFTWGGTCLEGQGVSPNVNVEVESCQLAAGIDQQMNEALTIVRLM